MRLTFATMRVFNDDFSLFRSVTKRNSVEFQAQPYEARQVLSTGRNHSRSGCLLGSQFSRSLAYMIPYPLEIARDVHQLILAVVHAHPTALNDNVVLVLPIGIPEQIFADL